MVECLPWDSSVLFAVHRHNRDVSNTLGERVLQRSKLPQLKQYLKLNISTLHYSQILSDSFPQIPRPESFYQLSVNVTKINDSLLFFNIQA